MAVNLNDLPPEVRKKVEAQLTNQATPPAVRTPRPKQEVPTCTWRCYVCDEHFTAWEAAERHADVTKHARIECVLT